MNCYRYWNIGCVFISLDGKRHPDVGSINLYERSVLAEANLLFYRWPTEPPERSGSFARPRADPRAFAQDKTFRLPRRRAI